MTKVVRVGLITTVALMVLGVTELLLWEALTAQWHTVTTPGPASLDEALILAVVAAAVALGGWLTISTGCTLLAHLPGRLGAAADRWARVWTPACSRRVAAVLVGAAVSGALAPGTALGDSSAPTAASPGFTATAPASSSCEAGRSSETGTPSASSPGPGFSLTCPTAAPASSPGRPRPPSTPTVAASDAPAPGWIPSRPLERPQPSPGLVTGTPGAARPSRGARPPGAEANSDVAGARGALGFPETDRLLDGVVVHRGDSLWDIARRHLGPDAGDAEVAEAWPAWYDRNRAVIGDDPDAILPGQILHPPTQNTRTTQATRPAEPAEPPEPALTGPTGSTGSTGPTTGGQR